jgi:hypothetical protein
MPTVKQFSLPAISYHFSPTVKKTSELPKLPTIDFKLSHNGHSLFSQYLADNPSIKKKAQHEAVMRALEASIYLRVDRLFNPCFIIATSYSSLKELGQSQDIVKRVLSWLCDRDYIVKQSSGNNLDGCLTTFSLLKNIKLAANTLINTACTNDVIVKDKDGNPITLANELIQPIQRRLARINQHLQSASFRDHTGKQQPICLKRVFSHSSLTLHGRFYDHYMNIPSINRPAFTVDNASTVVLDFRSMHPRLLYAKEGESLISDPYTIEGFERSEVKAIFTRLLNVTSTTALISSLQAEYDTVNHQAVLAVVREIREQHQAINAYLFPPHKDSSLIAMYLESTLIETILLRSIDAGLIMLPIHDALVVKVEDEEQAVALIHQTFAELYPNIIVDDCFALLKRESAL